MSEKISVIVPVYNVEKYLEKCIESILNQTYSNIELILVNDGSKDNSLAICKKYAEKDNRVIVIDKPNGGAASARNKGIEVASGEYIGFCDADDWMDEKAYETALKILKENNIDLVEFLSKDYDSEYKLLFCPCQSKEIKCIESKELIRQIYLWKGNVSLCTRLFKKSVIENIKIPEGRRAEDFYFSLLLLSKTSSVSLYMYPFYNCVGHQGSVIRTGGGSIYMDALWFYNKSLEFIDGEKFNCKKEQEYYKYKIYYLFFISATKEERKKYKNEIKLFKKTIKKEKKNIKNCAFLNKKEKIVLSLGSFSVLLVNLLYRIKNLGKKR